MEQALIIPAILIALALASIFFTTLLTLLTDFIEYLNGY